MTVIPLHRDNGDYQGLDAEAVYEKPEPVGPPVDPADEPESFEALRARTAARKPIVPPSLRSRQQRSALYRWAARYGAYTATYRLTRAPWYAILVAVWAPVGLFRTVARLLMWASAEQHNWALRQEAATKNDAATWLKLDRQREHQARWRWWVAGTALAAASAGLVAVTLAATWIQVLVAVVVLPVLARLGRPDDKPILDRVTEGQAYRKLTAEVTRRALASLGLAGINQALAKDPGAITFPADIRRDGPGWLAIVDLPFGCTATEVIDRRAKLASGLRVPDDQVWPSVADGHTGRLHMWVGDEPASQQKQPSWPLLRSGKVDVFKPFAFATDARLRPVSASLMARNWLLGGIPGSGKSFALRLLVLAASLDPRVKLSGYELKGSGDFDPLEPLCDEYGSGADDDTAEAALGMLRNLRQECTVRAERVKHHARHGRAPENKVTSELATKDETLRPLVAFIDESQELFSHEDYGKEAQRLATAVIKLGRALGIILILGTQRPDKDSLPTGLSANINSRFALAVQDQVTNDMILGTSAYRNGWRSTQFEPGRDAGWGWLVGFGKPQPVKSYYVDRRGTERVVARALELRGGPVAPAEKPARRMHHVLVDVAEVMLPGEDALWSEAIVERLAERWPDVYGDLDVKTFGHAMRANGCPTVQVWAGGRNRYGVRRSALTGATEALAATS